MAYSSLKPDLNGGAGQATAVSDGRGLAGEPGEKRRARDAEPTAARPAGEDLVARKIAELRQYYDVPGIDRVVAICCWGRSGSYFLASFLDGHDDVLTIPLSMGELIYPFWERHRHLSLREKLFAYPGFLESMRYDASFFRGVFRIGEADYHASVSALLAVYADQPVEVLETRATFFRFLVVAYNLAFGRRPGNPRPMIVHPQHLWSNANAQRLASDFPGCRFIHTVRDPISCFDSTAQHFADLNDEKFVARQYDPAFLRRPRYNYPAWNALWALALRDAPHQGMQERSIAVRFEDMHTDPRQTMGRVARWLGVAEAPGLLESTFNGTPWVVESGGKTWTGTRQEQVRRRSRNMSWVDRTLIFALLQENFASWGYPYPAAFGSRLVRALCLVPALLFPMRSELVSDRIVWGAVLLPALREANLRGAARAVWQTLVARVGLRLLMLGELARRVAVGKRLVPPI